MSQPKSCGTCMHWTFSNVRSFDSMGKCNYPVPFWVHMSMRGTDLWRDHPDDAGRNCAAYEELQVISADD